MLTNLIKIPKINLVEHKYNFLTNTYFSRLRNLSIIIYFRDKIYEGMTKSRSLTKFFDSPNHQNIFSIYGGSL